MGSKAARKIPQVLIEYLEEKHGEEFANWYVKQANKGKRQVTQERQRMSAEVGRTGAYHEGHFRGAEDIDPKLGGGPTTGLTMRPEIAEINIAHKEAPRIDYAAMREAGIPQNWITDVYETVLESEGLGVIGSYDTTAALDMDAGMDPGQAQAQTDRRRQLRAQGVEAVGPETQVKFEPFKGEIQGKPDVPLPDFVEGLAAERALERQQIAARRSTRLKMQGGSAILETLVDVARTPGVRRVAAAVPIAGTLIGAANVEASAAEREQEIAENPDDPTLPINKVLDQVAGWGDRTALAGYAATSTGVGAPAGVPMIAVGEGASLVAGTGSLVMDAGRAIFKWTTDPDNQLDAEERSALSFSSGAFK